MEAVRLGKDNRPILRHLTVGGKDGPVTHCGMVIPVGTLPATNSAPTCVMCTEAVKVRHPSRRIR